MKGKDVILGLLMEKSLSGYEINETFKNIFSHFFDGGYGMIYPTLRKLEKDGEITKTVIVQEGKPNKNEYSITPSGVEEFKAYLNSEVQPDSLQSDFLMRLYFGEHVSEEQLKAWIEEEIARKEAMIEQLHHDYEFWKSHLSEAQQLSYDLGIASYEGQIKVLKAARFAQGGGSNGKKQEQ